MFRAWGGVARVALLPLCIRFRPLPNGSSAARVSAPDATRRACVVTMDGPAVQMQTVMSACEGGASNVSSRQEGVIIGLQAGCIRVATTRLAVAWR